MSCVLSKLRDEFAAWCASYVRAFEAYDAEAIAAHWTFPALTTQAGRSFTFKSAEHFAKNTGLLLGFYQAQSVTRVEREVMDILEMSPDAVSVTVQDKMLDAAGGQIVSWQAAYVMQRIEGTWRAVAAVADGEVAAWAARGTPLGG